MSNGGSDFYENFTKNIYETIKGISHDERGDFIIQTYENLYGKLKTDEGTPGVNVDLGKLRDDLGHIRGIGGQRLDEIMAVIQRHLMPETAPQTELPRADGFSDDEDDPQ